MYHQEDTIPIGIFFAKHYYYLSAAPILFCFQKEGPQIKLIITVYCIWQSKSLWEKCFTLGITLGFGTPIVKD